MPSDRKRRAKESEEEEEAELPSEEEEEEEGGCEDDESSLASDDLESEEQEKPARQARGSKGASTSQQRAKRQRTQQEAFEEEEEEDDDEVDEGSLYIDAVDRANLMRMTELEREMILAERAEERDKARQRKQLFQTTREAEENRDKATTRNQRLSSRQKQAVDGKESAIKRLEAARKRKEKPKRDPGSESGSLEESELEESDLEDQTKQKQRWPSRRAREEEEEEEEEEGVIEDEGTQGLRRETYDEEDLETDRPSKKMGKEVEMEDEDEWEEGAEKADFDELRAIQLSRTQLENMYDKPFFEGEGLAGTIVRMAYGTAPSYSDARAMPSYMLMRVMSIQIDHTKSYPFGPKQARCNLFLELEDGMNIKRKLPMTNVSNQPLSDDELERYWRHRGKVHQKPITKSEAEAAKQRIADASKYRWRSSNVRERLEKKRAAGAVPLNMAAEKSKLRRMLELASANNNMEEVASLEAQLKELEERSMTARAGDARTFGMSHINKRNMEANFNTAFLNVSNKPANAPQRKGGADPFSRRETRPNISWNTRKPGSAQEEAARQQRENSKKAAAAPSAAPVKLKGTLARMDPAQLIQHLNIDIDVRPLQEFSIVPPMAKRLLGPRWDQSLRKHYNLDLTGKMLMSVADWKIRAAGQ